MDAQYTLGWMYEAGLGAPSREAQGRGLDARDPIGRALHAVPTPAQLPPA